MKRNHILMSIAPSHPQEPIGCYKGAGDTERSKGHSQSPKCMFLFEGESGAIAKGDVFPAHSRKVPIGRIVEVIQREKRCHGGRASPRENRPPRRAPIVLYMPLAIYGFP